MNAPVATPPQLHRLSVADFQRMAETGILTPDARVELIDGAIFDMAPIGKTHASVVNRLNSLLAQAAGADAIVAVQNPILLDDQSQPQPDLALLRWRDDYYKSALPGPGDILLLIEVADSSLDHDRNRKLPLYARSGVAEVWLIDLIEHRIECHRLPGPDGYVDVRFIDASAAPDALPGCRIDLTGLA